LVAGAAWVICSAALLPMDADNIADSSRRAEPLPGLHEDPRAAINSALMREGWVPNLDGTAVAYAEDADGLVGPDGRFRTDLAPEEAAAILHLDAAAIARAGSPREIDPAAVLFRAQAGTLSDRAKAMSRRTRLRQAAEEQIPDAVYQGWDVRDFAFTLDRLRHPDEAEEAVLAAIGRSKLWVPPRPGDAIRAVPVNRGQLGPDRVALLPGMLPKELPMTLAETRPGNS
jgi:hypothetical protein